MSYDESIQEVACQFNQEILDIQQHISFLKSKTTIHTQEIDRHNKTLQANGIALLPVREYLGLPPYELTVAELDDIVQAIVKITPAINCKTRELACKFDQILYLDELDSTIARNEQLLVESTDYFIEQLPEDPTPEDIDLLKKLVIQDPDYGVLKEFVSTKDLEVIQDESLRRARRYKINGRINALYDLQDRFSEIEFVAKTTKPGASTSAFRQGFITLMALFDAAVFDLVRLALRNRFFELGRALSKDKFQIQEIVDQGSFDAFRDEIINTQLKKHYLKGLLGLLCDSWKVKCVDPGCNDKHERLIEMVNRRNVHIHNRGVVDEDYLKMNLDSLKIGDSALIDEAYWKKSKELTSYCVKQIASWALGQRQEA